MQVKEDKCDVYYIDYGHSEVLDMRFIFDISDDLLMINYVACRVCLDGAESLDAMDRVSVADAFKLLVASKTFKCQVTDCSRPLKVRLFNENHQNVRDLLVSMLTNPVSARKFDYSPSVHLAGVAPYRPRHLPPFSSAPTSAPRPTAFQVNQWRHLLPLWNTSWGLSSPVGRNPTTVLFRIGQALHISMTKFDSFRSPNVGHGVT